MDEPVFEPIDEGTAFAIAAWRYAGPYARYDIGEARVERAVADMLRPELRFFVCRCQGEVAGFCSFGTDGQVPGGLYDASATDVGAGLAPARVGAGRGGRFLTSVVHLARHALGLEDLRATVATWNERAIRAATRAGFRETSAFQSSSGTAFTVLVNVAR